MMGRIGINIVYSRPMDLVGLLMLAKGPGTCHFEYRARGVYRLRGARLWAVHSPPQYIQIKYIYSIKRLLHKELLI
jgi:hypothetical protein